MCFPIPDITRCCFASVCRNRRVESTIQPVLPRAQFTNSGLNHGFHHLILSNQLVPVDGVRIDVQSDTDIGMPRHGLYHLDVGLRLGHQVGGQ
jgi:hypothetical protein